MPKSNRCDVCNKKCRKRYSDRRGWVCFTCLPDEVILRYPGSSESWTARREPLLAINKHKKHR